MKKIFKYIMSATLVVTGMMQFASCNDANDWTVDPSVTKQRPPTSLKVELADSASLDINVTIGTLANAASYELQVSESPLSSVEANDAATVTSDVWTIDGIKVADFQGGKYVLKRENEKFTIKQNTTYYFRIRAVGEDGTKSNWYTNGLLYNGSDGDEKIAQILLKNSYNNNSNLNSTSSLTTPSVVWITDLDVDANALTINWYETDYATAKYMRNETTGEERDISTEKKPNDKYTKTKAWYYTWSGLEIEKEYTFSLLDEDKNVISTFTKSTEKAPVMDWARTICPLNKPEWAEGGTKYPSNETVEFADRSFKITFHDYQKKFKGENKDVRIQNPLKQSSEKLTFYRFNTNSTNFAKKPEDNEKCYIKIEIPAKGRLYVTAYHGTEKMTLDIVDPENPTKFKKFGENEDEALFNKISIPTAAIKDENNNDVYTFVKFKLDAGVYYLSGKFYLYSFVFVPDEELPEGM